MEHSIFCAGRADCSRSSQRIFADGGYAGDKMALVVWRTGAWKLEIVKRSHAAGFEGSPKRWIVERTFAWISCNRRLARDFEHMPRPSLAFIRLAMIRIMLRRLAATASSWIQSFRMGSYAFRLSGTLPPLSASFVMTCLCSQRFISAEPLRAPV